MLISFYCKSRIFREHFIFLNRVKRHSCHANNSRLVHDLPTSVIDRVISQGFYFHEISHMRSFAKLNLSRKFPNLHYSARAGKHRGGYFDFYMYTSSWPIVFCSKI